MVTHISTLNCCGVKAPSPERIVPLLEVPEGHPEVDIYVINLQQIVLKGALSLFSNNPEEKRTTAWINALKDALYRANVATKYPSFVLMTSSVGKGCFTGLFVRQSVMEKVTDYKEGPSVSLATGKGGDRCSKRGSVSI